MITQGSHVHISPCIAPYSLLSHNLGANLFTELEDVISMMRLNGTSTFGNMVMVCWCGLPVVFVCVRECLYCIGP